MMNLILVGHQGSGKDAVAAMLPKHHRITIADPLRHLVSTLRDKGVGDAFVEATELLGYSPEDLMYSLRFYLQIPRTSKDRSILQNLGTYMREHRHDVWLSKAVQGVQGHFNVVTDVRYTTEFNAFKELGFRSIYVESNEDLRIARLRQRDGGYNESSAKHKSESEIESLKPLCNSIVTNNGTLEELRIAVDGAVAWLQFSICN